MLTISQSLPPSSLSNLYNYCIAINTFSSTYIHHRIGNPYIQIHTYLLPQESWDYTSSIRSRHNLQDHC
ncbi:hypothetical protein EYC80_004094 [Monilinia laxa]|uniref:Uncharacterized protein n=1 Tax=Monilinia laxa TaxID=61186 RepID=A0A5N6KLN4_MONLA|nr:hypothetical protein EYC80_004094 [Monilinia laxa]